MVLSGRGTSRERAGIRTQVGTQLFAVDVALVCALAIMWSRPYLPTWAKPELYGTNGRGTTSGVAWPALQRIGLRASVQGRKAHTLVVGDSVVKSYPWPADKLSHPGATSQDLSAILRGFLPGHEYERIILWPGTWDMMQRIPVETCVANAVEMARIAQQHAETVVLITPMPAGVPGATAAEHRANVEAAAAAADLLRERLPDVLLVDAGEFRALALRERRMKDWFLDNLHVNHRGFAALLSGALGPEGGADETT